MNDSGAEGRAGALGPAAEPGLLFGGGGEVGAHLARLDWSQTGVGPPAGWPQSLTTVVRMLLTSRFSMWMAWGEELTFLCNDAYRRDTLGTKFPWALGRSAREVWREIWPDIGPRIEHVMADGEATWDEALLLFLERSGFVEETYHTFSYSPLTDDRGTVAGMLCVVTEDTERAVGERRMATLRDLGSEPAAVRDQARFLDSAAQHLGANPRCLPFTATYLFEDDGSARLAATSGVEAGHPAAPERIAAGEAAPCWPIAELAERRTVVVDDLGERIGELPTGAWQEPPERALAVPLLQERGGRPYGFLVTALNRYRPLDDDYRAFVGLIAQRLAAGVASARSYEAERDRAEQLAALDRAKTAFFSNVSHELRTPLTLMLGPLGDAIAEREPLGDGEVSLVYRNGLRLLKLVNALLEFSRIEAGRMRAAFEPVDLAALTAELAGTFREATERAGLQLEISCERLPEAVYVDPELWERIVLNLVSNAFKFTLDGRIAVTLRADGDEVELTVSDTGAGIPEAELAQLFQRFHRVTTAQARSHEGSGIGLALVKELVELHGGRVAAQSVVGDGSRFVVRLPLGRAHLPEDQVVDSRDQRDAGSGSLFLQEALGWLPSAEADARAALSAEVRDADAIGPAAAAASGTHGARVLIADDNPDLRAYLERLLAPHWEVETAGDGATALEIVRERPPDLLISDAMMPGLDGFALLDAVRADPRTSELPVIMLSARAGEEAAIEGLEAGADDYLSKPFSGRDLVARVRANLELSRVRRGAAAELREERQRLEQTLDQLPVGVILAEAPSGRLMLANSQVERILGHAFVAAGGVAEYDAYRGFTLDGEPLAPERMPLARAIRDGEVVHDEDMRYATGDGRQITVRVNAAPIRDEHGRVFAGVVVLQDVTEQVRTERLLAVQRDVLAMVAQGAPLERTLAEIVRGAEGLLSVGGARGCILLRSDDGARFELGAAPSLSDACAAEIDARGIDRAERSAPGAWWSTPIHAADGQLVGSFALHREQPHEPQPAERRLVEFLARTAAVAIERHRDARARARQLAELQSSLLPGRLPEVPGMQVAVAFHPATRGLEVGGDFYDLFPLRDGSFGFVIGDVCGHGAAAAAVTALTRHTTRAVALLEREPARVLATVNAALQASDYDRFCSAIYGCVQPHAGGLRLHVSCGGHPPPMVRRASGEIETLPLRGTLLGVVDDPVLPQVTVELGPGDVLLMHTDGLTERNPRVDGDDALRELVAATPAGDAQLMLAALQRTALGPPPHHLRDDVAILLLRADEPDPDAPERRPATQERTLLDESYPAQVSAVPRIRAALRDAAERAGGDADLLDALALAVSEAVTNAVLHAYRDGAARDGGAVDVSLRRLDDTLEVLVGDRGGGIDPEAPSPGLGLGLPIISTLCDSVEVRPREHGGIEFAMRFDLARDRRDAA